eukprot:403333863
MVESTHKTEEDMKNFSAERWLGYTKTIASSPEAIDVDTWVAFLYETTNLFKKMGSAMSMAFSDITSKAEFIAQNKEQFLRENPGKETCTLQDLIEDDIRKGVEKLNGENNDKLLKKDKLPKDDYRHKFTSTARTVLRNMWLLDFLHHFMNQIYNDRTAKLSSCAKFAYSEGLGPHHPWAIRQVAKVGMLAAPSRDSFLTETKATYEQIDEFRTELERFRPALWSYYKEKNLIDLP